MSFTTTDDHQEIYFEAHGAGATTLVFVSGYFGIANIWQPVIRRVSSKYRCIAYDSRGYGRSSKPTDEKAYSIPRHAADLHTVLTTCNVRSQIVLITHSMGGSIGAAYHLAHPDRVTGLIQTGTYLDGVRMGKLLTYDMLTAGVENPSRCVAFYTAMGLDPSTALEAAKWPAYCRRHNAKALLAWDIGDRYATFNIPGLVVQGDLDQATPVESLARPIADAMPRCRLEVLKGVVHFPPTEAPADMERLIEGFVKEL
ncbi:putative alpha/beta fold family hydrolase [Aspergillus sclerotiicarbonarius CBS 121057]|uniref:Putative alpha/beta fold family hydrolase n=1 Tax=Aspergillus sclerotiicarbonarius (strain CBS 121057 / IBT 28362) TaxID=1448318 RepID=A0A319E1U9_ASPSB|nr:putative alpha/beta fold family hydrolase [Aspergillus sclerotiicarbonarius CBS 121057]